MVRQLLALLALLTGLAAMSAPVQAAVNGAVSAAVERADSRDADQRASQCPCAEKQRKQKARGEKVTPCKAPEPVTIFIPSVMFGADRAIE
ncbi:hypothetical protein [Qipengyuania sphaerica]|uniref:hypothetical protein n=1 Tax=Qipengyuania sphaerica TaxID=2867243 RepID=UPI001C87D551|nr:hypothetical protein [Qipengyuania sphaerica]MBX7540282.1 hypothetical protein [Qipengyuania sphaerica]